MRVLRFAPLALLPGLLVPGCFGYIRSTILGTTTQYVRTDTTGIQFLVNSGFTAGAQSSASGKNVTVIAAGSDPLAAARAATNTWNSVAKTAIHFLAIKTSADNNVAAIAASENLITFAATSDELSVVGGALAVTIPYAYTDGTIASTNILFNPAFTYSTDGSTPFDLQTVMTHELGHALGLDHTGLIGATMFQVSAVLQTTTTGTALTNQRILSSDEIAFANQVYPSPSSPALYGTISGFVASGGNAIPWALMTAIDAADGLSISGLAAADGTYSLQVPPGTWELYTEPLTGLVRPGNLYFSQDQANQAANAVWQSTAYSGTLTVTVGSKVTANIAATPGVSALPLPFVNATTVNGKISSAFPGGPIFVSSGGAVDLVLDGVGYDATLTDKSIRIYGGGVTVRAGSVRVDPNTMLGSVPIVRVTLDIAARQSPALASIFITRGTSTFSLSGAMVVQPPTPTFGAGGVDSAASNLSGVSPGEYVAIYAATGGIVGPSGGPLFGGYGNNGYDVNGFLPATLAGVSVTFDGIPAPIFFTNSGQINLQTPFEVAGKTTTQVVVNFGGSTSVSTTVAVVAQKPAIFGYSSPVQALAANQDFSLNSAASPAPLGSTITVYGTGVGKPGYAIQTGAAAPAPPGTAISANGYTATVGGKPATVAFAGWTPSAVALAQWNITLPSALSPTGAVPIVISGPGASSTQTGIVVYVK